jgi:hypothetical protein
MRKEILNLKALEELMLKNGADGSFIQEHY